MKKLLILSGKGGAGKTTTAAAFIAFAGARAFADCDVDAPNLHLVAQLRAEPERADFFGAQKAQIDPARCCGCGVCLAHCRFGAIAREGAICRVDAFACEGCGVCAHVCPQGAAQLLDDVAGELRTYDDGRVFATAKLRMGRGNSGKLVFEVKANLEEKAGREALAVIDGSPGIGCPVIASVSGADLVLVVAEPSLSGRSDLERVLETARILCVRAAVCVNKADVAPAQTQAIEQLCAAREIPFVGCIPYDRRASEAVNAGRSLAEIDCLARDALREVYEKTMALLEQEENGRQRSNA